MTNLDADDDDDDETQATGVALESGERATPRSIPMTTP